ncbi:DEAD/DEAH box helicase [Metasolibacillus fluoroglycofenilyticus]|uniref:DEAD/DEAH box helicase n=1 Tax=Metasolibacillus fluoroglycofenilyticus TaxID=1239396 RepID=UPI000D3B1E4B|nr:DEAD/DEAH box helicase [Metasolibacillus fluoroglycofenilyticus]
MKDLTLNRLKNTNFKDLYKKLIVGGESLTQLEYRKLLSLGIIFINEKDHNIFKLGYRIIVFYCNQTKDYKPLYDFALNQGLYPIVKIIEKNENYNSHIEESFFKLFQAAFGENYKVNDIYLSEEQKDLNAFFISNNEKSITVIAPTSYGKSELIISTIKGERRGNVCIVVPTKALISQTKRRIMKSDIINFKKIITHPEMYIDSDVNVTAVLTQERLLRLLRNHKQLHFDIVFIDEAHNLLEKNERSILLASVISILEKRNSNVKFKFLTPFLIDQKNLSVRYTEYDTESFKITEYIKTERFYIYDERNEKKLKLYDQFLNEFFYESEENFIDETDFIIKRSTRKNIIYLNKPVDIEKFAFNISQRFSENTSTKIKKACADISNYLDPDYLLINCFKRGIIYHHGLVPDNIKMYIEHLYSEIKEVKYIITSSTLLEGVNIPAYSLFLLDNKKGRSNLSPAQFKNLVGRICRFSEVFSPITGDLKYLEPHIYIIGSDYTSKNANLEKFIKSVIKIDKQEQDFPTNVLLKNVEINDENISLKESADEFIENFEPGVITDYDKTYAQTKIGRICFANNINEIDIIDNEQLMQNIVDKYADTKLKTTEEIFEYFSTLFLPFIKESEMNIKRLSYPESRNFYKMFLDWRIRSASYREMIYSFIKYWSKLESDGRDTNVYVGRWGDKVINGYNAIWTDIKTKTHKERINLAIVRIKEEQDFLDNIFIKYIEVLNDINFVDEELYNKIKYGTSDKSKITLIKNGLSLTLVNLLVDKYSGYFNVDNNLKTVTFNSRILDKMKENDENEILIYEVKFNTIAYLK